MTRFFIGEDYRAPRAFGIYKEQGTDKTVVYMNTNSGARKLYYEGTDEAEEDITEEDFDELFSE